MMNIWKGRYTSLQLDQIPTKDATGWILRPPKTVWDPRSPTAVPIAKLEVNIFWSQKR